MSDVRLSAGVIDYHDTGGDGPVVVLLHGVAMDGSLWDDVVAGLGDGVRCIVPTLPLGGHRRPMDAGADLSVLGVARLVAEFLEALGLEDVTLVMNDWGGAQATWGWMSKRPVPHATMDRWFRPLLTSPEIRRDLRAYVLGVPEKAELLRWTEQLRTFDRPALVIWATEDRVMPLDHGRRLAEILPQGRLVEIADSYTLLPQDRPDALVEHIGAFLAETA